MTSNVRRYLNYIQRVLVKGDQDARDLCAIMSALRGPDNREYSHKQGGTVPVRRAAFPKLIGKIGIVPWDMGVSYERYPFGTACMGHFWMHIQTAKQAIERPDPPAAKRKVKAKPRSRKHMPVASRKGRR